MVTQSPNGSKWDNLDEKGQKKKNEKRQVKEKWT